MAQSDGALPFHRMGGVGLLSSYESSQLTQKSPNRTRSPNDYQNRDLVSLASIGCPVTGWLTSGGTHAVLELLLPVGGYRKLPTESVFLGSPDGLVTASSTYGALSVRAVNVA